MKTRFIVWPSLIALAGLALLPLTAQAQDIHDRRATQNARIRQGVASGSLTHREAANIRARRARIGASIRRDRATHGGRLTRAERARLNRRLNRSSRVIYRDKHNGAIR